MEIALTDAAVFAKEFFSEANTRPPPHGEARLATSWFEERMHALANKHDLYCQNKNKASKPPGEWMNVDHVFVLRNHYDHFPVIAVEHENRDLSEPSKKGRLPGGTQTGAYIEWAAWKMLTMQARLHVLVAYPWAVDKDPALHVLSAMVTGYREHFRAMPNALFLLGWWQHPPQEWSKAEALYTAYAPTLNDDECVTLSELPPS